MSLVLDGKNERKVSICSSGRRNTLRQVKLLMRVPPPTNRNGTGFRESGAHHQIPCRVNTPPLGSLQGL